MSSTTVALDIKSDPSQRYNNNPLHRTGHPLQLQPSYHIPRKNESGSFGGEDDVDPNPTSLAAGTAAGTAAQNGVDDDSSGYHHDQHHHAGSGLDGSSNRHDDPDYSLLDHEDLDPSLLSNQHDDHGGPGDEGNAHAEHEQDEGGGRPPVSTNSSGTGGAGGGGKSKSGAGGGGGTKRKKKDEDMIVDPEAGVVSDRPVVWLASVVCFGMSKTDATGSRRLGFACSCFEVNLVEGKRTTLYPRVVSMLISIP